MQHIGAVLLFVIGGFIGLKFPDFDHAFRWLPLLGHRSILTHGVLAPLLLIWAARKSLKPADAAMRLFLMGLCLGSAVHLAFDLFPWAWQGYSLIHVPFYGRLGAQLSWVWVLGSVLGCLLMSSLLLRNIREFYLGLLGLVVMYGVSAAHEPGASFWALVVLLAAAFLAFVLPRRRMVSGGAGTKTGTDSFGPGWL